MAQQLTIDQIEHNIANVWSLEEYLAFLNRPIDGHEGNLVTDAAHWADMDIITAAQLADYIGGCCARNVEKSEMYA